MSDPSLLARAEALGRELAGTEARLADPEVVADRRRYIEMTRRYRSLQPVVERATQLRGATEDLAEAEELMAASTGEDRDAWREEVADARARIEHLEAELRVLLLPRDPNDERDVIVEIRGAEGGEEANLFARDLLTMYEGFAARRGWVLEVLSASSSELGGFSEVVVRIAGDGAWSRMKFEAGPHRVQRVPVTESQGRIHTSSATVVVLPEADEVDVDIDPADLQVDVFRSSGPGGQSVNTTDSAVRVTHRPTGLVVSMQDEKSQLQNRAKALRVLRSRLLQLEQEKATAEASGQKRAQIGGGGRSEKIRTYNFKENRVTDHRIGMTVYSLDRVLAGELDAISDALLTDERARQLAELG
ncbi:MAG: peptide chain release factor 1 [Actinobacteria bacterium]|nr:peptide chain release factor 1 [Actinomycetota bacterium]